MMSTATTGKAVGPPPQAFPSTATNGSDPTYSQNIVGAAVASDGEGNGDSDDDDDDEAELPVAVQQSLFTVLRGLKSTQAALDDERKEANTLRMVVADLREQAARMQQRTTEAEVKATRAEQAADQLERELRAQMAEEDAAEAGQKSHGLGVGTLMMLAGQLRGKPPERSEAAARGLRALQRIGRSGDTKAAGAMKSLLRTYTAAARSTDKDLPGFGAGLAALEEGGGGVRRSSRRRLLSKGGAAAASGVGLSAGVQFQAISGVDHLEARMADGAFGAGNEDDAKAGENSILGGALSAMRRSRAAQWVASLAERAKGYYDKYGPFQREIRAIEARFGTSVSGYFRFFAWIISCLMLGGLWTILLGLQHVAIGDYEWTSMTGIVPDVFLHSSYVTFEAFGYVMSVLGCYVILIVLALYQLVDTDLQNKARTAFQGLSAGLITAASSLATNDAANKPDQDGPGSSAAAARHKRGVKAGSRLPASALAARQVGRRGSLATNLLNGLQRGTTAVMDSGATLRRRLKINKGGQGKGGDAGKTSGKDKGGGKSPRSKEKQNKKKRKKKQDKDKAAQREDEATGQLGLGAQVDTDPLRYAKAALPAIDLSLEQEAEVEELRHSAGETLRVLLHEDQLQRILAARTRREWAMLICRRVSGVLLGVLVQVFSGWAIISMTINGTGIEEFVARSSVSWLAPLSTSVVPTIVACINAALPYVYLFINEAVEAWDEAAVAVQVLVFRIFVSRVINIAMLMLTFTLLADPYLLRGKTFGIDSDALSAIRQSAARSFDPSEHMCRLDQAGAGVLIILLTDTIVYKVVLLAAPIGQWVLDVGILGRDAMQRVPFEPAFYISRLLYFTFLSLLLLPYMPLAIVLIVVLLSIDFISEYWALSRYGSRPVRLWRGQELFSVGYLLTVFILCLGAAILFFTNRTFPKDCAAMQVVVDEVYDSSDPYCGVLTSAQADYLQLNDPSERWRVWARAGGEISAWLGTDCIDQCGGLNGTSGSNDTVPTSVTDFADGGQLGWCSQACSTELAGALQLGCGVSTPYFTEADGAAVFVGANVTRPCEMACGPFVNYANGAQAATGLITGAGGFVNALWWVVTSPALLWAALAVLGILIIVNRNTLSVVLTLQRQKEQVLRQIIGQQDRDLRGAQRKVRFLALQASAAASTAAQSQATGMARMQSRMPSMIQQAGPRGAQR